MVHLERSTASQSCKCIDIFSSHIAVPLFSQRSENFHSSRYFSGLLFSSFLVPSRSSCRNELPLLLEGPLQLYFCRASVPEKITPKTSPFIWNNWEHGNWKTVWKGFRKIQLAVNHSCYCVSVGNKHQMCALQNPPDVICPELQYNQKCNLGIAHQRVLALITTKQPLHLMLTQDCLTQGLPKWREIIVCRSHQIQLP